MQPLKFRQIFKELVWGGERLLSQLDKPAPAGKNIGESWELADLPNDQSVVVGPGPWAGRSLGELVASEPQALLGPVALDNGRFPLLVKFIDARDTLSVQVHPDADAARSLGSRPKSEAWYILAAEPGSRIILGLRPGVSAEKFLAALEAGRVEDLLLSIPARVGDLIPVAPGTLHAIGGGVMLVEVQQPSDTTYRVYDWGRVGLDGKPRELHIEQAMISVNFEAQGRVLCGANIEADLQIFRLRVFDLPANTTAEMNSIGPRVLICLDGEVAVHAAGEEPLIMRRGETVLLPHVCRPAQLRTASSARMMYVTLPG